MDSKQGRIIIISGEGETGTIDLYTGKDTPRAIKARITRERCGGDRWATAYRYMHDNDGGSVYGEIDGEDMRHIDDDDIEGL